MSNPVELVLLSTVEAGIKFAFSPAGNPLTLSETVPVKPLTGVIDSVYAVLSPTGAVAALGDADSEKVGGVPTVKFTPALTRFAAVVTMTFPVVAFDGTVAVMLVSLQLLIVAAVPLKLTPPTTFWFAPNPLPLMVTCVPTDPFGGCRLRICGMT